MNETPNLLKNSFSKKNLIISFIIFICIFAITTYIFIHFDTVDNFYEYTRKHEDWELDELILGVFAFFIALSFALFYLSYSFGKKVIAFTQKEIEHQKRLQMSQKLQSMGSMLGGLAHSLNNHLVPIITLSKMIKDDIPKENPNHEDISKVLEASYSLRDILKQVLNFTRADNENLTNSCHIDETLDRALELVKTTLPSSIKLQTEIEKSGLIIPISSINMEIIIFNLITNAIHALEAKKTGVIKTSVKASEDKSKIVLTVKDNGCGINKDTIDLIFDPFFTTKEQGKGTGLGLSETFGIIKSISGTINVESKENEFTQFTLEIPTIKEY